MALARFQSTSVWQQSLATSFPNISLWSVIHCMVILPLRSFSLNLRGSRLTDNPNSGVKKNYVILKYGTVVDLKFSFIKN